MEMDGRNEQTEIEDHTLVDIEEQATQHVVTAMKGMLQSVSGRQKTMDGRNEQTEMIEFNIRISSSHGITWSVKSPMEMEMDMDGRNVQSEIEDHNTVIVDIKDNKQDTPQLQRAMEDKLQRVSSVSEHRCIYRVPKHLRDTNEAAYVPRLVSLGPFHHGKEGLEAMEEHKWRCFKSFIEKHHIDLAALLMLMKTHEEETKGFYADRIALPSDQFVQVILVDAIFVINFLLDVHDSVSAIPVRSIYDEDFFYIHVYRDMTLLENQIPLFIMEKILHFAKRTDGTGITEQRSVFELSECLFTWDMKEEEESVTKLSNCLFNCHMKEEGSVTKLCNCLFNCHMKEGGSVTKLSNCLFNCFKKEGTDHNSDSQDLNSYNNVRHFVDFRRLFYMPVAARRDTKYNGKFKEIKSISKLHKAGVIFKVASAKTLLDITFKDGVLEIPLIVVNDSTETIFRNILAYDQCHYGSSYISDYFVLMGMLIDTADDVELLVKNKILRNHLATEQEVSKVFNNLEKEVISQEPFYYSDRCNQINDYCEIPRHKWMAALKQNYLDTPWKVISLIAAIILLVLTMIQTVCSVISL